MVKLEKAMDPHSSTLACKVPWMEEPGRLVHGVTKSLTRLSDFTFTFHFHALEKEMATYSSVLALRIPGTGETSGLPSMGSHRVGHDWSDLAEAAAAAVGNLISGSSAFSKTSLNICSKHKTTKWGKKNVFQEPSISIANWLPNKTPLPFLST